MNLFFFFTFFNFHFAQVVHPNDITIENVLEMAKRRPTFIFFKPRKKTDNQNIIKIWEKLSSKYMTNKKIVISDFSCAKYHFQCKLMNISSFPSIYAFYGPDFYVKYNGRYSFPVVDKWINKMSAPPVSNISTIDEIFTYNFTADLSSESVKFLSTKEEDYQDFYELAYFRNSSNIFFFYHQQNDFNDKKDSKYNNRITAFLNSHFLISSDDDNISISEFVWKNQFHVPFKLTEYNIKVSKNSKDYLVIYVTKFKNKNYNYDDIKLNELNASLYKQLEFLGEKFYEKCTFCWSDIHAFPIFFKGYGITKAPALLVLKDDLYWATKVTDVDHITSFLNLIFEGQIKGEKISNMKVIKYDVLRILARYPMLAFLLLMLLGSFGIVVYFIRVHMERLRRFERFEREMKEHRY